MVVTPGMSDIDFKAGTVLLIDKPLDWTSFDVVNKIRYALKPFTGKIKVGHAGTLDPKATGLLIVCTGRMTKQIESFTALEKAYTGTFILGATTPSFDTEKEVDHTFPTEHITSDQIEAARKQFLGEIRQFPPMYSAVKKEGVPLYVKARKGQSVDVKARSVVISEFNIDARQLPIIPFRVTCSKGTYIRSLANDFGKALGSGAYLGSLVRTRIGDYSLDAAWQLDDLIKFIKFAARQSVQDEGFQGPR